MVRSCKSLRGECEPLRFFGGGFVEDAFGLRDALSIGDFQKEAAGANLIIE
jgi:hypothetical protein